MPLLTTRAGGSAKIAGFGLILGPTNYPVNLTATANSSSQITLTWTNNSQNWAIRVYRNNSLVTTLTKGTTSYVNTGLAGNTSYSYKLAYFGNNKEFANPTPAVRVTCYNSGSQTGSHCSGTTLYLEYADGSCGTYSTSQGQVNGNCGYCDPYGTFYGEYCSGQQRIGTYANGSCGSFDSAIGYTQGYCGYCDPSGTYYGDSGETCSGTTRIGHHVYANGTCGSYITDYTIGQTQGYCGYCDPYSTFYSETCSGTTRVGTYANGSCGTYTSTIGQTQGYCGYCDPAGTHYGETCSGTTRVGTYANGSCGTYTSTIGQTQGYCGYCDPAGTVYSQYCDGYTLKQNQANGSCGTNYGVVVEYNSCACGNCPPSVGVTYVFEGQNSYGFVGFQVDGTANCGVLTTLFALFADIGGVSVLYPYTAHCSFYAGCNPNRCYYCDESLGAYAVNSCGKATYTANITSVHVFSQAPWTGGCDNSPANISY